MVVIVGVDLIGQLITGLSRFVVLALAVQQFQDLVLVDVHRWVTSGVSICSLRTWSVTSWFPVTVSVPRRTRSTDTVSF